jgi:hypothetical protein
MKIPDTTTLVCLRTASQVPILLDLLALLIKLNLNTWELNSHPTTGLGRGWTHIRVNLYPCGGVARLRARGVVRLSKEDLTGAVRDLAAAEAGGVAVGASNAHYGRPSNLIAPGRAAKMDEGTSVARKMLLSTPHYIEPNSNPGSYTCNTRLGDCSQPPAPCGV